METTSKLQSDVMPATPSTIWAAVRRRPEIILRGSDWPLTSTLTCCPPTSIARMSMRDLTLTILGILAWFDAHLRRAVQTDWSIGGGRGVDRCCVRPGQ